MMTLYLTIKEVVMINIEMIANELGKGVEYKTDRGFMTKCPCHMDQNLSLRLWKHEEKLRYRCNAGCSPHDVKKVLIDRGHLSANTNVVPIMMPSTQPVTRYYGGNDEFSGISSSDLLLMDFEEPELFISPILRGQSITMIYAKAGVGKSWLVHSIALALTRENPEMINIGPWKILQGCGVCLIDGELPTVDLQSRLQQLTQSMGRENSSMPLTVLSNMQVVDKSKGREHINLADEKWRKKISHHFRQHPECKLLILDNLSSLIQGENENTKKSWEPINQWVLTLRSQGVSTIFAHHANKSGTDRGHSCHKDQLDTVIRLNRGKEVTADQVSMEITFEKARNFKPGEGADVHLILKHDNETGLRLVEVDEY